MENPDEKAQNNAANSQNTSLCRSSVEAEAVLGRAAQEARQTPTDREHTATVDSAIIPTVSVGPSMFSESYLANMAAFRTEREQRDAAAQQEFYRARARERASTLRSAAGVLERYATATLNGVAVNEQYAVAIARLRGLLDEPAMIALVGQRGTGKTHAASATVNGFCLAGRSAMYTRATDVYLAVRETFRNSGGASEAEILRRYTRPALLVVDEIQIGAGSEWEGNTLTHIIDERYASLRSTILIANLTPEDFVKRIGDSIASRLQETGGIVLCTWPSFRARTMTDGGGVMSESTTPHSEPVLICMANVVVDPKLRRAGESGYRRGLCQGYCAALDDRERHPAARCNDHLDTLMEWRYRRDPGVMTLPPELASRRIKIGGGA